jgi:hypothetical protein
MRYTTEQKLAHNAIARAIYDDAHPIDKRKAPRSVPYAGGDTFKLSSQTLFARNLVQMAQGVERDSELFAEIAEIAFEDVPKTPRTGLNTALASGKGLHGKRSEALELQPSYAHSPLSEASDTWTCKIDNTRHAFRLCLDWDTVKNSLAIRNPEDFEATPEQLETLAKWAHEKRKGEAEFSPPWIGAKLQISDGVSKKYAPLPDALEAIRLTFDPPHVISKRRRKV